MQGAQLPLDLFPLETRFLLELDLLLPPAKSIQMYTDVQTHALGVSNIISKTTSEPPYHTWKKKVVGLLNSPT